MTSVDELRAALAALSLLAPLPAAASAIDLHVHLLMDESVPLLFRGRPSAAPPQARGRLDRWRNQIGLRDLESADVRLLVAALYAPAVLSQLRGGYHRSLLRQIDAVEKWAAQDPRISIVRTPEEAEAVLRAKDWRLGVILSAEGAGGADTLERLDRLWERGLRMLTIAHFVDTRWGGAAQVSYWPRPSCAPGGAPDPRRNPTGLVEPALAEHAVAKGLLLDLTHSSDRAVLELAGRHPGLPLLFTHQAARELTPCERTISPELLREVRRSRGMVGVTLASHYVGEDLASFLAHAQALSRHASPDALALGTDYNGTITRVEGAAGSEGYARALEALEGAGIPARRSAQAFVALWKRALDYGRAAAARTAGNDSRSAQAD